MKEEYATVITRIEETVKNGNKKQNSLEQQQWSGKKESHSNVDKNVRQMSLEEKLRNIANESVERKAGIRHNYKSALSKKTERATSSSKEPDIYEEYDRNFGMPDTKDRKSKDLKSRFLKPVSRDESRSNSNSSDEDRKVAKSTREWDQGKTRNEWDQRKSEREWDQGKSGREWDIGKRDREWDQGKLGRELDRRKPEKEGEQIKRVREWDEGKLSESQNLKDSKNDKYHRDGADNLKRDKKNGDKSRAKYEKESKRGKNSEEKVSKIEKDYDDDEYSDGFNKRRKTKSKNKYRSRSSSEERGKKVASHQNKRLDEKSEHICLEEWTPDKPSYKNDPTMESLRLKLKQKEDKEEEEERQKREKEAEEAEAERKRKLKEIEAAKIPPPPPPPEPPQRNPVAIQWGAAARSRATPDKSLPMKKNPTAFVGKMPGRGPKKMTTPDKETAPAPATVVTQSPLVSKPVEPVGPPDSDPQTTANIDIKKILEASQAHIKNRKEEEETKDIEIPLPPLPAAQVNILGHFHK